jgi:hypothetical protein
MLPDARSHAIEQSRNKHIERIRVASANQLKSGDLSVKTSNRNEAEALKQFANDWVNRIEEARVYGSLHMAFWCTGSGLARWIWRSLTRSRLSFCMAADLSYQTQ